MRLALLGPLLLVPLLPAACAAPRAPVPPPVAAPLDPGITPLTVEQERDLRR